MKIYSHRGNINGKNPLENQPGFLMACLEQGFHIETDLWFVNGYYYIGHDTPDYLIDIKDFDRDHVVFHLKTPHLPNLRRADAFAIDSDPYVVTLRGLLWTNYGQAPTLQSVMCSPELVGNPLPIEAFVRTIRHRAAGICTDYPILVRETLGTI